MNIHGYQAISSPTPTPTTAPSNHFQVGAKTSPAASNFATLLQAYTEQVNHDVKAAAKGAESLAAGESRNTSETLLAIQKADLSFQMMLSVRNKLVDAYREIIRMQV